MDGAVGKKRVCVTGAGGFVASWLVKLLLSRGHYMVHGTVRDPGDAKNAHLKELECAMGRLQLFKADLLDYTSMVAAIAGCEAVFHVACPVLANNTPNPEVELIAPSVTGTMNVLRACSEVKVKTLVVVSSVSAVMLNPDWPAGKAMDEDSWSDVEHCKTTQNWYCLAKTLAEREAFEYGRKNGLDVVSVCPSLVIGPLLQSTLNASSSVMVDYFKGDCNVLNRQRNFVDVRDVADAILLVYENPEASGRYICHSYSKKLSDIIAILRNLYPNGSFGNKKFVEVGNGCIFSSEKLQKLGWKMRPLEETLRDSVESYSAAGAMN